MCNHDPLQPLHAPESSHLRLYYAIQSRSQSLWPISVCIFIVVPRPYQITLVSRLVYSSHIRVEYIDSTSDSTMYVTFAPFVPYPIPLTSVPALPQLSPLPQNLLILSSESFSAVNTVFPLPVPHSRSPFPIRQSLQLRCLLPRH